MYTFVDTNKPGYVKSCNTLYDAFNEYTKVVFSLNHLSSFSLDYCNGLYVYGNECAYSVDFDKMMIKCKNTLYCNYLDPNMFDINGVSMTLMMNKVTNNVKHVEKSKVEPMVEFINDSNLKWNGDKTFVEQPRQESESKSAPKTKDTAENLKNDTLNLIKECSNLLMPKPKNSYVDQLTQPLESFLPKMKSDNDSNSTVDDDDITFLVDSESEPPSELESDAESSTSSVASNSSANDAALDEIKQMIKLLEQEKKDALKDLEKEKAEHEKQQKNAVEYNSKMNELRRDVFKEKEKEEERQNIYRAGKTTYRRISADLEEGKIDDVPIMFKDKYYIYQFMDENDILDEDNEYETFITVFNRMYPPKEDKYSKFKKGYVPHNINYLDEEQKKKFLEKVTLKDDVIEEFINKNTKIPPLEDILNKKYEDDSSDVSDVSSVKTEELSDSEEDENVKVQVQTQVEVQST